jgi:hypothetical protein
MGANRVSRNGRTVLRDYEARMTGPLQPQYSPSG